jgi:hypothetical protein
MLPDDLELALPLHTDDTVSAALDHRDPGEGLLADLATLVAGTGGRRSTPPNAWAAGPVGPSPPSPEAKPSP